MNISYDFKKAKELNNDISGQPPDQSSDDDDTELSTPETRPTLSNNSSNQKFDFLFKPSNKQKKNTFSIQNEQNCF